MVGCANNFFSLDPNHVQPWAQSSVGSSPLIAGCLRRETHLPVTCQLHRILAPYRLGGAIGSPRDLGACDLAFPPANQHHARRTEGAVHHPDIIYDCSRYLACKMYATLVLGVCIMALLCYPLPGESVYWAFMEHTVGKFRRASEFLPGKRALAIGLCVYHSIISTVLFQAPRFIPFSFGAFFEACV